MNKFTKFAKSTFTTIEHWFHLAAKAIRSWFGSSAMKKSTEEIVCNEAAVPKELKEPDGMAQITTVGEEAFERWTVDLLTQVDIAIHAGMKQVEVCREIEEGKAMEEEDTASTAVDCEDVDYDVTESKELLHEIDALLAETRGMFSAYAY
uniref:AlNc14C181G8218 protein n=1 Tax=Albugo laibachii Nc14 TaxID=890382 RepID=F0WP70_9STRA|nr:AlNc14C181G8218 [Albugo laibachii Nc14]|eukprot:CCA23116.1 AlNc14C181G8218 [Albugo laibachii Nc14]